MGWPSHHLILPGHVYMAFRLDVNKLCIGASDPVRVQEEEMEVP